MSKHWHQNEVDKAHESTGTIRALQEAAQQGAALHLASTTLGTSPQQTEDGNVQVGNP